MTDCNHSWHRLGGIDDCPVCNPPITKTMLADIEFVHRQLKLMGKNFDRKIAVEYVGRSIEFVKGVLWEKEQASKILPVNEIGYGSIIYQGERYEKAKSSSEKSKDG